MPEGTIRIFGAEIPAGRFVSALVGLILAVGAGAWVYTTWIAPEIGGVRIPPAVAIQMTEAQRHIGQEPEGEAVLLDDARGRAVAASYPSGCFRFTRTTPDQQTRTTFLPSPEHLADFAGATAVAPPPAMPTIAAFALVDAAFAGEKPCPQGRCLDPHPGEWRERKEQVAECFVRVWREWDDACVHYQDFNICGGGAGPVSWVCCAH